MNLMEETLLMLKSRENETAIINQEGAELSFSAFYDHTTKLSFLLRSKGLGENSKVVLLASLDWPLYCAIAACFQIGATVVLVDPWANSDYIEKALSQVNPEFLIISKKARLFYLKKSIRQIPWKILLDDLINDPTTGRLTEVTQVEDEHTALITFTSGTTGIPKGFDRSHFFLLSQQKAHDTYFDHHEKEIDLSMYPVFVLSNLKSGMTSVLIKGNLRKIDTIKPEELYQQLTHYKVASISVSPVILEKLVRYCEDHKKPLPLKKVFTGGAPVRRDICERLLKINPDIGGWVVYGSTEAEPIALVSMKEVVEKSEDKRAGTPLGRIVDALTYDLLPPPGKVHPYHQGKVGEVALTGDFVGKRYWNNEKAFHENKWVDEQGRIWHKTGDMVLERDSFLSMIGRKSNPIQTPLGDLYPVPVENQIDQLSGVKKSAYLQVQNKIVLAYEGDPASRLLIEKFFVQENLPCDEIKNIESIPMDARHRSKIDLPSLKTELVQGPKMTITHDSPLFKRLLAYTNERFPLVPIFLFVFLLTSGYAHFFAAWFKTSFSWQEPKLWITMGTVFLFMLQLRMADEIKDFGKDSKAFPERILSRGIIKLDLVRAVLYSTILIELIISALMGTSHLIFMIILQIWANLMAQEFFCKEFLDPKVTLNLVLHQFILVPLALYSALPFITLDHLKNGSGLFPVLLFLTLLYTVYEMARKTWSPDRENENADSYTRFWGINGALIVQGIMTVVIMVLMETMKFDFPLIYRLLAYTFSGIYLLSLIMFKRQTTRKMSKMVETGGSIFLLGMCALNAFAL
ncbi:MAG: AMP-binding protein [Bacteriovoracaceae bacterium]|nr:AMP-binding protein [Bacteriovoracaceae bacterium]